MAVKVGIYDKAYTTSFTIKDKTPVQQIDNKIQRFTRSYKKTPLHQVKISIYDGKKIYSTYFVEKQIAENIFYTMLFEIKDKPK